MPTLRHRHRDDRASRLLDPGRLRERNRSHAARAWRRRRLPRGLHAGASPWFVERWRDRLLNIHPSLLPAFRGLDTHRRVLAAGVRFTAARSISSAPRWTTARSSSRPSCRYFRDDAEAALAARVLAAEHRCYPLALELVASGRAWLVDEHVMIDGATIPDAVLLNPAPSRPAALARAVQAPLGRYCVGLAGRHHPAMSSPVDSTLPPTASMFSPVSCFMPSHGAAAGGQHRPEQRDQRKTSHTLDSHLSSPLSHV